MSKRIKGITLMEVLFASAIIALVLVGIILIFAQTVNISKRIDREYIAVNLAKSRLERVRTSIGSGGFSSLPDLGETDTEIDIDSDGVNDFRRSTTVTTNYDGKSRLTKVDVKVVYKFAAEWKENAAVTVTTIFVDMG